MPDLTVGIFFVHPKVCMGMWVIVCESILLFFQIGRAVKGGKGKTAERKDRKEEGFIIQRIFDHCWSICPNSVLCHSNSFYDMHHYLGDW